MVDLPTGAVTFLFTDIEGSTTRWERHPEAMREALARHDALLHEGITGHGGVVITERGEGDSFFALFARPSGALAAACGLQQALTAEPWPQEVAPLRVRMALHTGEDGLWEGRDYRGAAVNRCARLRAVAHGGQVLLSGATYELVRDQLPPGVTLRDLGEHRLKDLARPEHIFQAVQPDLPADFPALKTMDTQRHTLPVQLTPFIGREREVAAVRERLLDPQTHLLTLTGPGGTGKTRLALQVAADVLDRFPDGVFFVNLAPIGDPHLVLPTIAQTLGVMEQAGEPLLETLQRRMHGTRTLLVLDNVEQVVDAAPQVGTLLGADADLKALVTSRVVLRVQGEREYPVPPLALPDPHHLPALDALSQYEAVRLFIARAQDVNPGFAVTNETARPVAEICVRLDGLPLAIELVAARLRVLPPQAMLTRLGQRLTLAAGGARDLPARQQTLRATIDWSYHLLTPDEQALFARLAVFVGGSTLEAIEAICNADGALDVLEGVESLVTQSLLRQEEDAAGEPRFAMLETIREYALERLAVSEEEIVLRECHVTYFVDLVEAADRDLDVGQGQALWLARLEQEHDNLRAALQETLTRQAVELALRLSSTTFHLWQGHNHEAEGRQWLEAALALDRVRGSQPPHDRRLAVARVRALTAAGWLTALNGDQAHAVDYLEQALGLARRLREPRLIAKTLQEYGGARRIYGDLEGATDLLDEEARLCDQIGDRHEWGRTVIHLGLIAHVQGDDGRAEALLQEALAVLRAVGEQRFRGFGLAVLGRVTKDQGDYAQARHHFAESASLLDSVGDHACLAFMLEGSAALAAAQQDSRRAARLFGAAAALRHRINQPMLPVDRIEYERDRSAACAQLDAATWASAWAEGQAMTLEQAIASALADGPPSQQ